MSQAISHAHESSERLIDSGKQTIAPEQAFRHLRSAYRQDPYPSYDQRMDRLGRLLTSILARQSDIKEAIRQDFGNRSTHETTFSELFMSVSNLRYTRKRLKKWMKPERRRVPATMLPGRAMVHYQPVGVVGVISPWNYPFLLAISPVAAALAAGNRVLLKPSEYTPATSALLQRLIADVLEPDIADVVLGGPEVGEAFAHLPFDHLLFTGSTQVGRIVMKAAAENLTPVTLELGGKSPTIVHESYPVDKAATRIAFSKCFNAGQTCIAPDYLLVHESKVDAMAEEIRARIGRLYPTIAENPDYTSIVSARHYERLRRLVEDAEKKGAKKVEVNPAGEQPSAASRKLFPTLLLDVKDDMAVMQEEIFGPLLPIVPYRTVEDAIEYVNARPRPLALYMFDDNPSRVQRALERTVSGGATINDLVFHFAVDDMPFGGIGPSGMGSYHGFEGFQTFSHKKGVFYQSKWNTANMLLPPYGARFEKLMKRMIG